MINILFVDDDVDVLKQSEIMLSKQDDEFDIETAVSGEEALDLLSKDDFDIIISDYKMPSMDGIELLKNVRDKNIEKPFIILTAAGDEEAAMDALNFGADRYMIKKEKLSKQFKILSKEIKQEIKHYNTKKKLIVSEMRYEDLVKNLPVGIYKTTPKGKIIDGNKALADILGYSDISKLKTVNAFDLFVNPEDRKKWIKMIKEKGIVEDFEYKVSKSNGELIWVEDTARAVKDDEGLDHFNGIIRDVTEIKELEEELGQSKEWLSLTFNILDSFGDPIITTDDKGKIAFINSSAERLFGIERNQVVGDEFDNHFKIYYRESDKIIDNPIERIIDEKNESLQHDLVYMDTKEGKETVICDANPIFKKSGNIIGTILSIKKFDDIPKGKNISSESGDFGELYDYLPNGIVLISSKDYTPMSFNNTALEYLEYTEEQFKRKSIFEWPVESEGTFTYNKVKESLTESGNFSTRVIKKYENGREKILSFDMRKIKYDAKENLLLSIYDITKEIEEMKKIEQRSNRYKKAYDAVEESIVFGRLVKDKRGKPHDIVILDVNSSFQDMMGIDREEILGNNWSDMLFRLGHDDLKTIDYSIRTKNKESFKLVNNRTKNKIDVKVIPEKEEKVILVFKQPYV